MADQPPEALRPLRSIVVLLVDDQRFVWAAVRQLLTAEADIELQFCEHAAEAIAMANRIAPTVVLQDLVMPEISGLTLVGLFKQNPQTAATPVIVLSGNDDAATRSRAMAEGAADYLVKLPSRVDLVACIRRHASGRPERAPTIDPTVMAEFEDAGSPDFTRSLIDQFLQESDVCMRTLESAEASGNSAALLATAHSLKGSSSIMGAKRLAALCGQVEDSIALSPRSAPAAGLMTAIEEELGRVREALAAHRPVGDH